jgi:hypothetical protein
MLKFTGDKKPAYWRALLCVAVLAPANPDAAVFQMLDPDAGGVADILDDLVPGFRAFVVAPRYFHQLDSLDPRRCDQALQAMAHKLVGISRFGCGVGCLIHVSLLANFVCIHSICTDISWQ